MSSRPRLPILRSFAVAVRGIRDAVAEQRNLRIHLILAVVVNMLAVALAVSLTERLILWLCIGLVLATELLNTAIETVVDLASPQQHELARKAKDIAAGAVLAASLVAALIGAAILGPPLLTWKLV